MKFYKLTDKDGHGTYSVDFVPVTYEMGKTLEVLDCPPAGEVCGKGLHVCDSPLKLLKFRNRTNLLDLRLGEVEVDEANIIAKDKNKTRVSRLTVTKELDIAQLFRHNGEEIVDFIKSLSAYPWLKPNKNLDEGILEQLVHEHFTELATYSSGSLEGVTLKIVRTKGEYYAAWNAAYNAAYNAARNAACNAAYNAARSAAYYAAYYAAWNAAYDAAYDAAQDAAYDAAWNAAHLVSGLPHNPRTSLMEIWALGCAPVGVINNEFVVYVPEAK